MAKAPDRVFQESLKDHLVDLVDHQSPVPATRPLLPNPVGERLRLTVACVVVGAVLLGSWAGITALQRPHRAPEPATHTHSAPAPTAAAVPKDDPIMAAINRVVGTGTFTGPIRGSFTITHEFGSPVLHLRNLDVGTSKARQLLVAVTLASASCRSEDVGTLAGTISARSTQTVYLQDSSPQQFSDLSYMSGISVLDGTGGADCVPSQTSAAVIHWTLPPFIRNLAATDHGSTAAAHGAVQTVHGRPFRYTVASNDQISDVAARFGLTPQELLYLNPLRRHGNSTELYVGEQLNLDPTNRAWFWR